MDGQGSKGAIIAISLVVGLVIGGVVGYGINMGKEDTKSNEDSKTSSSMSSEVDGVTVGGAKMVRTKDIVDNAAAAKNVTTVVSLVKLAGLVDTLKSEGPFTVFGPNNGAFAKIDAETVASLQKPENVETLKKILTYHVVPGTYTSADLKVMAQKGETLTTVEGETLSFEVNGNTMTVVDAKGGKSKVETADVISSNGVTHVIDSVLMPAN